MYPNRFAEYIPPADREPDFWQAAKGTKRTLFAVGYNKEHAAVRLVILDRLIFREWVKGAGLMIDNGINDKLGLAGKVYLKAPGALVADPQFIYAVMQTLCARDLPLERRYGKVTWQDWDPKQLSVG